MKKLLALLLAACMLFSLAACGDNGDTPAVSGDQGGNAVPDGGNVEPAVEYPTFDLGTVDLVEAEVGEDQTVGHDSFAGEAGKDYTDLKEYTYNDYTAGNQNLNFNPISWETNEDSAIFGYTTSSLYDWRLNSTKDGWSIVPEMAAGLPEDVTADYVGRFGIQEGDDHRAYKITLNPDICWQDGTPITADDYIYTWQMQLDPIQANRRADSLYAGSYVISGAKEYFYQGKSAFSSFDSLGTDYAGFINQGHTDDDVYIDLANFWGIAYEDGTTYGKITDETLIRDPAVEEGQDGDYVSPKYLWDNYLGPNGAYAGTGNDTQFVGSLQSYEANYSWDNVGLLKTGDYEIVLVYTKPLYSPEYYIPYNVYDFLINRPLYESLLKYYDANGNEVPAGDPSAVSTTTTYGTTPETYMGYGPYVLTTMELDKQMVYTRNENWWGYKDGKHTGMYQTDKVVVSVIPEQATALLALLNGEIDGVGLTAADMEKYGSSDNIYYTPDSYTTKLSFNTDEASLAQRGTQVLGNLNFRKAFGLAIDKATFVQSFTASAQVGHGLLNYMYLYDPFSGGVYRETEGAKKAIVDLYGLTYGEGGDFDTLDEAYDAVTGYDLDQARQLMALAYDQCVADGSYTPGQKVTLDIRVYSTDETYVNMFNFLKDALESACVGTGFEGNVTLSMTADADYYETMYAGNTDVIFTTWGGAASSPYTMLYECYCDASDGSGNQMEYGFDTSKVMVTIELNGHEFTNNLQAWALWCDDSDADANLVSNDGELTLGMFSTYDNVTRSEIFGKLEYAYLANWTTVPLYYRMSASLLSQKVNYATREYVDMVGFGGLQYATYNYDDTEWEAVKSTLQY